MFLVHAVMALAGHHVKSQSTDDHHYTALKLFRESLDASSNVEDGSSMLDAIMILFSFDVSLHLNHCYPDLIQVDDEN